MAKKFIEQDCLTCSLYASSVFKHLTQNEIKQVFMDKNCTHYKRGTEIYHEGSRTNGIYCINNGIIKLFKTGYDGREQIIRFAKAGDIIGYRSLLSKEVACTTAKTIEDASLCYIPGYIVLDLVKSNPDFSLELIQLSCKELGDANKFIIDIAQKNIRERLAEVLLLLRDTFGLNEQNELQVSLTREELANIVGTATESVIRLLSEFKADKLIEIEGRKIRLLEIKKLTKISNVF